MSNKPVVAEYTELFFHYFVFEFQSEQIEIVIELLAVLDEALDKLVYFDAAENIGEFLIILEGQFLVEFD